jgi:hypothetical protein
MKSLNAFKSVLFRPDSNWNNGAMEYWNDGVEEECSYIPIIPAIQYSNIPIF